MSSVHAGVAFAQQLRAERVDVVFTLTGGHISPLIDGCDRLGIRVVDMRHEQAVAHAADGYARCTRRPAFGLVTAGPGMTGALTGLANAFYAGSPAVVVAGANPLPFEGLGTLQDAPHLELARPVVKHAGRVTDAWRVPQFVAWAARAAAAGRPGPAFVEFPLDLALQQLPADAVAAVDQPLPRRPVPDPAAVDRTVRLLRAAQRPVVLAGSGAYWDGADDGLPQLAELLDVPVFCNGMARGLLPPGHRCLFQLTRSAALREADLVLALGVDFDFRLGYGRPPAVAASATLVQVDVDAARIGANRPAQLGVVAPVDAFVAELLKQAADIGVVRPRSWTGRLAAEEAARREQRAELLASDRVPIHPLRFAAELAAFAEGATVVGDGGDVVSMASSVVRCAGPGRWLDPGPFGCLGVGVPFAIAAKLARPDERVVGVFGDGAFGFNGFELDTAVRHRLPFVAAVGNDGAWGEMRTFHEQLFGPGRAPAQYLSQDTRYDLVAAALGGYGERVTEPGGIAPALRRAEEAGCPAVVDVVLDQTYRHRGATAQIAQSLVGEEI